MTPTISLVKARLHTPISGACLLWTTVRRYTVRALLGMDEQKFERALDLNDNGGLVRAFQCNRDHAAE